MNPVSLLLIFVNTRQPSSSSSPPCLTLLGWELQYLSSSGPESIREWREEAWVQEVPGLQPEVQTRLWVGRISRNYSNWNPHPQTLPKIKLRLALSSARMEGPEPGLGPEVPWEDPRVWSLCCCPGPPHTWPHPAPRC